MIVIGVDAHKATHTAAAVNRLTAEKLDQQTVKARQGGHDALLAWAIELGEDRVWAIEDCRALSGGLERVLLQAGERVLRVPPKLMAAQRKAARSYSKSDPIDALAIARAAIREPGLPEATLPGIEHEIGLLVDHRDDLVQDATAHQRRLRWHLHQLDPDLHVAPSAMNNPNNLDRLARKLQRLPQSTQVRICRELIRRIRELTGRAKELERELRGLVEKPAHSCWISPAAERCAPRRSSPTSPESAGSPATRNWPPTPVSAPRRQFRPPATPPSQPHRQPPPQPRPAHHRRHPGPHPPARDGLLRPPQGRRQDQPRSPPSPQALHRPQRLQHPPDRSALDNIGATHVRDA